MVPQDGHVPESFDPRTVILVVSASWIALSTTKPLGTNEYARNDRCMVLILPQNQHITASKLHQK
jgi:hypothetical protein